MVDAIIILVVVVLLIFALRRIDQTFQRRGRLLWRRIRQRENEKSEKEDARRAGGRTAHDPYLRHALPELCQQRDQRA